MYLICTHDFLVKVITYADLLVLHLNMSHKIFNVLHFNHLQVYFVVKERVIMSSKRSKAQSVQNKSPVRRKQQSYHSFRREAVILKSQLSEVSRLQWYLYNILNGQVDAEAFIHYLKVCIAVTFAMHGGYVCTILASKQALKGSPYATILASKQALNRSPPT